MKKVLVISSSLRLRSDSESLADAFARGASEAGNEVEKITIREKNIRFCKGCLACPMSNSLTMGPIVENPCPFQNTAHSYHFVF